MDLIWPDPIPPAPPLPPMVLKEPNLEGSPKYPRSKHKCKKYIEKKIDYFSVNNANLKKFSNLSIVLSLFYIYLFKKYKSGCVLTLDTFNNTGLYVDLVNSFSNIQRYTSISKQMLTCIKRGVNIIVIPLYISAGRTGHANILIYRKATNVLEHFEPHGAYYGGESDRDRDLVTYETTTFWRNLNMHLKKANIHEVELVESFKVCPHIRGFQSLEGAIPNKQKTIGGYCTAWSMFFTELALANPALSSKEIVEIVFIKGGGFLGGQYMKDIIEGYSNHVSDKIDKYYSMLFNEVMTTVDIQCRWDNASEEEKRKIWNDFLLIRDIEMELIAGKYSIQQKIESQKKEIQSLIRYPSVSKIYLEMLKKKLDILEKMQQLDGFQLSPTNSFEPSPGRTSPSPPKTKPKPKSKSKSKSTSKVAESKSKVVTQKAQKEVIVKTCPEGEYLNPVTNRCNKIKTKKDPSTRKKRETKKKEDDTKKNDENDDGTIKLIDY
uniref:Uncharacterized protein n=1 Tax=viral metagenome TaxID=1070528 RepID=A0A6C0HJP8_9ZZZZ